MDQNLNNSQNEFLWKLLANPADEAHLYGFNLQRLVNDFPQSGLLQALLAHASEEKNLKQASVYFNSKSLYKLINAPASFADVPADKLFVQGNIGSYNHNDYGDELKSINDYAVGHEKHVEIEAPGIAEQLIDEPALPMPEHEAPIDHIEPVTFVEEHLANTLTARVEDEVPGEQIEPLVPEVHREPTQPELYLNTTVTEPVAENIKTIFTEPEQQIEIEHEEPLVQENHATYLKPIDDIEESLTNELHVEQAYPGLAEVKHTGADNTSIEIADAESHHNSRTETLSNIIANAPIEIPQIEVVKDPAEALNSENPAVEGKSVIEQSAVLLKTEASLTLEERLERILNEARGIPNPSLISLNQIIAVPPPIVEPGKDKSSVAEAPSHEVVKEIPVELPIEYEVLKEAPVDELPETETMQQGHSKPVVETIIDEFPPLSVAEDHVLDASTDKEKVAEIIDQDQPEVFDRLFQAHNHTKTPVVVEEPENAEQPSKVSSIALVGKPVEVATEDAKSILPEAEEEVIEIPVVKAEQHLIEVHVAEPVVEAKELNQVAKTYEEPLVEGNVTTVHDYIEHVAIEAEIPKNVERIDPVEEHMEPVTRFISPEPAQDIEDEVFDEIVSIEQIRFDAMAAKPEDETDKLIKGAAVGGDYLMFDRTFGQRMKSDDPSEPEVTEVKLNDETQIAEAPVAGEAEKQDLSSYHDEKMPYSFMWWLNKTRKEHAAMYQPFVKPNVVQSITKTKNTNDELQQQYYENIFHITSVEELDKNVPALAKVFEFGVKRKEEVIIERFIEEEPTIKPQSSDKIDNENKAKKSSEDRDEMVTETLAGIYAEQMLYHKAIASYRKLILKFPEKSRYFALKIEQLEKKTS